MNEDGRSGAATETLVAHLTMHPARSVTLPWEKLEGAPRTADLLLTTREGGA
jgi:hypothetical protein